MTTALDLISLALKQCGALGVGQTAAAEDTTDALRLLNMMLSQWQRKRWSIYHLVDLSKVSTGASSYTVGTGGDFNVTRPDRIEAAYVRQLVNPNPVDYPLRLIESREDYSRIALKSLSSFPTSIFYDANFPTGTIYPYPLPLASIYEIHIVIKAQISQFASLTDTVTLPPEYEEAIYYNLAGRLASMYKIPVDPVTINLARASLNTIKNANAQIATLRLPSGLGRGGLYNPYSDQIY